jgi:NAD(P)-dependent dehydrogenase (short-subunit alcohol dehydrogenase family)
MEISTSGTSAHAGRIAVVTGSSSGIGRGIARRLQQEGAWVSAFDITEPRPDERTEPSPAGRPISYFRVDVSQEDVVEAAFDAVVARDGPLDYLVCCAAVFPACPFLELTTQVWQRTLDVNLTGSFMCCRAALRSMRPRGSGRIVLFASNLARRGGARSAAYATSKGGILGLARSLAIEVADEGIRVNTLSPGVTDTPQPRGYMTDEDLRHMAATIPLGRIGEVADVVESCLFLLSEESSYVIGQDLRVNGGLPLW